MRKTIRSYTCVLSLVAALAVPVSAATTSGDQPDDFLTTLKNILIVVFDDAKIILPTG
jgi:hypothetical protein